MRPGYIPGLKVTTNTGSFVVKVRKSSSNRFNLISTKTIKLIRMLVVSKLLGLDCDDLQYVVMGGSAW